jgi:diguanylate cyclase (GGDEF)-like protein
MLAIAIVEVATGTFSPFVQHWGLEIGGSFDTVGFSLALVLRARYHLRERTQIERELAAAAFAAGHDELTGLLNRRGLDAHLGNLAASESTVLFGDLDGFKLVNDMSGHAAGDDILRSVAGVLQRAVRAGDIIARIGGDEFVVVLAGSTDRTAATQTMARIAQSVSVLPLLKRSDTVQFGMSIGMGSQGPGKSFDAAIAEADADAYRVKSEHYAAARERARNLQA